MHTKVRWGTEFEDDDCERLIADLPDDVARALDNVGWQIVKKPGHVNGDSTDKWMLRNPVEKAPNWAISPAPRERRRDLN